MRRFFLILILFLTPSSVIAQTDFNELYSVYGDLASDQLGSAGVYFPGDLDEDGVPDTLIAGENVDSADGTIENVGLIRAFSGANGGVIFDSYGDRQGDRLGSSGVYLPGDLNEDGIPDIIVSSKEADSADGTLTNAGLTRALSGADGSTIFSNYGDQINDGLGSSGVYLPGDLDGDDIPDILVAGSNAGLTVGLVRALSGADGDIIFDSYGDQSGDRMSESGVVLPGDLNGDEVPDILIAGRNADSADSTLSDTGLVRAISGANGDVIFNFYGDREGDGLGESRVYLPGDLDGDDKPDIIIAASIADSADGTITDVGLVRALSGADGSIIFNSYGDRRLDRFAVGGVYLPGDLNEDGTSDILVAGGLASSADGTISRVGLIRAISGTDGSTLFSSYGDRANDAFSKVYLPGDLNGDGTPDFLVASNSADTAVLTNAGLVRAISGRNGDIIFNDYGEEDYGSHGQAGVFLPGDLDLDGRPDIVVSSSFASSADGTLSSVGLIRAVSGANGNIIFESFGDNPDDYFGNSGVYLPGDLDGDDVPDIVVASGQAYSADGLVYSTGLVRAVSGSNGSVIFNSYGDAENESHSSSGIYLPGDLNGDGAIELIITSKSTNSANGELSEVGGAKVVSTDLCVLDPGKILPGTCGCGIADTDTDTDGNLDCNETCDDDPEKIEPGICGCGVADTDNDSDGALDCNDECPSDPLKIIAGVCGCGEADIDSDSDGTADCNDECETDLSKIAPGICGCGIADTDSDADGTPDCTDECPNDLLKTSAGVCGCGVADVDENENGVIDCTVDDEIQEDVTQVKKTLRRLIVSGTKRKHLRKGRNTLRSLISGLKELPEDRRPKKKQIRKLRRGGRLFLKAARLQAPSNELKQTKNSFMGRLNKILQGLS